MFLVTTVIPWAFGCKTRIRGEECDSTTIVGAALPEHVG
jgi:hypothetical protein